MKYMNVIRPVGQTAVSALFIAGLFLAGLWFSVEHLSAQSPATTALPLLNGAHPSALPLNAGIAPEVGCWFMSDREAFREEGYRWYMDNIASRSTFELFSASTRYDLEVTDPRFHDLMKEAATYAADRYGVGILLDLDIRLARRAFAEKYPHALQERLFLQEQPVRDSAVALSYEAVALEDHYTGNSVPYRVLGNRFVKAWTYVKNEKGEIVPNTLRDISREVAMASDDAGQAVLRVSLPDAGARAASQRRFVCGIVAFSYLYPDLFAPELQSFEKEILYQYRDVPLKGICKDEWGFPPDFTGNRDKDRYWYSETMRKAYAEKHPGRVLADDAFLMYLPQEGMEREREQVIDRYNRLCFEQQVRIETAYVEAGREVFGVDVFPATHPTWWPWPDSREFTKNQLSWWKVPRTYAQTDECVPYFCRTSLAKGTNTVWYNMFYAPSTDAYVAEHWGAALAGGRVNIHPLYPAPKGDKSGMVDRMREILDTGIDEARHKIRLLDLITRSPVDAPVAVVFGHWGAMNWARPEYDRVGSAAVALCNALAGRGYPVDLTPSSQAGSALWRRGADGYVYYGEQRYAQIVFFGESDSDRSDFEWLENLSGKDGKTQLVRMAATAGGEQLIAAAERISGQLHASRIAPQTAWLPFSQWDLAGARPPLRGKARYIDGTQVWTAAEKYPGGDELTLHSEPVGEDVHAPVISVSATGLFACRFSEQGELVALAAGALKRFEGGGLSLDLGEQPTDLAMWIGPDGKWHGVIQAAENRLPEGLAKLNGIQWKFLAKEEVHSLD